MSIVPVIDLLVFVDGDAAACREVAELTDRSGREISFLCVTGRRVPQELSECLHALSKDFFRRESVEGMHVAQPAFDIIRGRRRPGEGGTGHHVRRVHPARPEGDLLDCARSAARCRGQSCCPRRP